MDAHQIGRTGLQDHGQFQALHGVGPEGAVLIRPDGHVARRSTDAPSRSKAECTFSGMRIARGTDEVMANIIAPLRNRLRTQAVRR